VLEIFHHRVGPAKIVARPIINVKSDAKWKPEDNSSGCQFGNPFCMLRQWLVSGM